MRKERTQSGVPAVLSSTVRRLVSSARGVAAAHAWGLHACG
ncbi:hypothetical protein GA0115246_113652 [Streptomyces sp. SolWspMP-sol7th]|nr:hypothetical protein GA0115246_113652 [Streptomyces sp. SolWspMP-sol7th]